MHGIGYRLPLSVSLLSAAHAASTRKRGERRGGKSERSGVGCNVHACHVRYYPKGMVIRVKAS